MGMIEPRLAVIGHAVGGFGQAAIDVLWSREAGETTTYRMGLGWSAYGPDRG